MRKEKKAMLGVLALALGGTMAMTAVPAYANDADVITRGPCSGASDWKLKASPENGRIEVQGEVDSNVNGQRWRWQISHNGALSARGAKITAPPSGSFEVRRLLVDAAGPDKIGFRAKNAKTGEVCRGSLTF